MLGSGCYVTALQGRQARGARTTAAGRLLSQVVPLQVGPEEDALCVAQIVLTCSVESEHGDAFYKTALKVQADDTATLRCGKSIDTSRARLKGRTCFQGEVERSGACISVTSVQHAIVRIDAGCDSISHDKRLELLLQLPAPRPTEWAVKQLQLLTGWQSLDSSKPCKASSACCQM